MASISLIALKTLHYGGRLVLAGQPFKASSEQDARVLKRIGRAKDPGTAYQTASIDPGSETIAGAELGTVTASIGQMPERESAVDEPRRKRTYRRRDLTAESSESSE